MAYKRWKTRYGRLCVSCGLSDRTIGVGFHVKWRDHGHIERIDVESLFLCWYFHISAKVRLPEKPVGKMALLSDL